MRTARRWFQDAASRSCHQVWRGAGYAAADGKRIGRCVFHFAALLNWGLRNYGGWRTVARWDPGDRGEAVLRMAFPQGRRPHGQLRREVDLRMRGARRRGIECPETGVRYDALGAEPTPQLYIAHLTQIFSEVMRVLKPHGTLAVNIGDSYASGQGTCFNPGGGGNSLSVEKRKEVGAYPLDRGNVSTLRESGLKPKDLCLIPERFAIAMQEAGAYVRARIIWAKSNAGEAAAAGWVGSTMPESAEDRPTRSHEHVWLFAKQERYWWDKWAVAEEAVYPAGTKAAKASQTRANVEGVNSRPPEYAEYNGMRNQRDVWTLSAEGSSLDHYAMFPPKLPMMSLPAQVPPRCCVVCGEPWVRQVTSLGHRDHPVRANRSVEAKQFSAGDNRYGQGGTLGKIADLWDLGFFPDCSCGSRNLAEGIRDLLGQRDTVCARAKNRIDYEIACVMDERDAIPDNAWQPGIVLDPFLGSGTITQVAQQLGIRSVGIEMNEDGERVIRERLSLPKHGTLFGDEDLGFRFEHITSTA